MINKPLQILFVASEMTPFAKVGGLGDVIGSLPKALVKLGIDVRIIVPQYELIAKKRWKLSPVIKDWRVNFQDELISVFKPKAVHNSVKVFFVKNKKYLSQGPIYFERTAFARKFAEIKRFLFFSRAVFELIRSRKIPVPDILHCHDWHSGALVNLVKRWREKTGKRFPRIVFTIHNLGNQGKWNAEEITRWFGPNDFQRFGENFNFLAQGIVDSDKITSVSPNYSREILTKEYGEGLQDLLRTRKKNITGILNGIDYAFWPAQKRQKLIFQKYLGFKMDKKAPIFGLVSRLTRQKGIDLIIPLIERFVKKFGAQFVFLGMGQRVYEDTLKKMSKRHPENIYAKIGFDEKLAHRIYGNSDFFLMPSLFEPCGLGQMIGMHYGTIPIVRATGGLKDTVKHLETGFVFQKKNSQALARAMEIAINYFNTIKGFKRIKKKCISQNFDWSKSAKEYKKLYLLSARIPQRLRCG